MSATDHSAVLPTRRALIAGATAFCVNATVQAAEQVFFQAHGLPIGLQLYTLGEAPRLDLDGSLSKLSNIGYRTVEFANFLGRTPQSLRTALDRAGLSCTSIHAPLSADPGKLAEQAQVLGFDRVITSLFSLPKGLGVRPQSGESGQAFIARAGAQMGPDDWKWNAELLNQQGEALRREGLKVGYHNHNPELRPLPGRLTGLDILLRETDPALVTFEMDAGWVAAGGHDPIDFLHRHPGRFELMHVKDLKPTTTANYALQMDPTEVGSGVIDWRKALPAAYTAGVRRFFVEQEPPFAHDRFEAAKISFDYLSRLRA